jgi:hypothetical protein
MKKNDELNSLDALNDIKRIMEQSTRFLSLSGWSGIWAGTIAILGGAIAYYLFNAYYQEYDIRGSFSAASYNVLLNNLFILAFIVVDLALAGAYLFTKRKIKKQGLSLWNQASKRMLLNIAIPMVAGGIMILGFLKNDDWKYVAPACLIFYGLALINGSKYTHNDIRFLGIFELILGCICIFFPGYGLYFWIMGFGILHIVYGVVMWRKYDSKID